MFCSNCGAKGDGGNICTNCSAPLQGQASDVEQQPRKKSRAPLIAVVTLACVALVAGLAVGIPWAYNQFFDPNVVPTPPPTASATPTDAPTPSVIQTPIAATPTTTPAVSWANGATESWRLPNDDDRFGYGLVGYGFAYYSESVWIASFLEGDITSRVTAIDPTKGEILWETWIAGTCAEQLSISGELACIAGNYDQPSIFFLNPSTGEKLREVSPSALALPKSTVASVIEPFGDDLIVAFHEVLNDNWLGEGAELGDLYLARLKADGTLVWKAELSPNFGNSTSHSVDVLSDGSVLVTPWSPEEDFEPKFIIYSGTNGAVLIQGDGEAEVVPGGKAVITYDGNDYALLTPA
ncbi:MAG: hypothetical protein FWG47_03455 [Propionibacteriaceae bacterium]|nr:hypothetical protein [Propionibacteriaceae bacterium]